MEGLLVLQAVRRMTRPGLNSRAIAIGSTSSPPAPRRGAGGRPRPRRPRRPWPRPGSTGAARRRRPAQDHVDPGAGQDRRQRQGVGGRPQPGRLRLQDRPRLGRSPGRRSGRSSRPLASASLTITPRPAAWASLQGGTGRAFEEVPGRLDAAEEASAVDHHVEGLPERLGLARAGQREPDRQPLVAEPPSASRTARSSRTPLSSVAEWIW